MSATAAPKVVLPPAASTSSSSSMSSKQLRLKANEFLGSRKCAQNLVDILHHFQECVESGAPVTPCLLTLEQVFSELFRRREMLVVVKPLKQKDTSPDTQYREWLQERLRDMLRLTFAAFDASRPADATQALVTAMRLLAMEGKYPVEHTTDAYYFPINRLRNILVRLMCAERSYCALIARFKEFAGCLDVLFYAWKIMPSLTSKGTGACPTVYVGNYLDLVAALPITAAVQDAKQFLCAATPASGMEAPADIYNKEALAFDYATARRNLNKSWMCAVMWPLQEAQHRQMLIVLLETVLVHLDKPVLLTDFLMDSLDVGGPISLLALQGVFTLIQQHNLTYPNVYEKLYSMFEPEIFHTKFKARLFYLADIFLSSISLPEILVAAFVKRLARLALVAPPQDILIILYFIGNLIIRHPGLKRLMCHPLGGQVGQDPFLMDERQPGKSNALESSLWEVATLQQHAVPTIAQAARFIQQPLPSVEWDLATVLELNEDDIFDQEIVKRSKECALTLERPSSSFQNKQAKFTQYWQMC